MSTSERSQAYGRVIRTLHNLGPAKLLPHEEEIIREAADTLLFTADPPADAEAGEAVAAIEAVAAHLVESERWTADRAALLVDDVLGCGQLHVARAEAA